MLSDELSKKAVSLSIKSTDITLKVLENAIKAYLRNRDTSKTKQGKQSLKKLNTQNQALQDIPITAKDMRGFKRELRSYGVDYAIKKDLSQPDTFKVYFKGRDTGQIENALKNHMAKQLDKKPSIKERMQKAIEKAKEREAKAKEQTKEKDISKKISREER